GMAMRLEDAGGGAVPADAVPAALPDRSLALRGVDHNAQEDARRMQWSGQAPAAVALLAERPQDLSRETNGDVLLVLTLRRESAVAGAVDAEVGCGEDCGASLPLQAALARLPENAWTTLGLPLKCFAAAGADMTRLQTLLRLRADGPLALSVSRVALGSLSDA